MDTEKMGRSRWCVRLMAVLVAAASMVSSALADETCSRGTWFEVTGDVGNPTRLSKDEFLLLPSSDIRTTTNWSKGEKVDYLGPRLTSLLALAKAAEPWKSLTLTAVNDYSVTISREAVTKYQPIVSHTMNGQLHERKKYGPTWLILPRDEFNELKGPTGDAMFIWGLCKVTVKR